MNKKSVIRYTIALFVLMMAVFIFAACAEVEQTSSQDGQITLDLNSVYPPPEYEDEPKYVFTDEFAERVEEKTDGRVKVEVHYSNQLVDEDEALDALANGTIDMVNSAPYWGDTIPTLDLAYLPFGFLSIDHAYHVVNDTDIGEIFEENLEDYGVKVLMYRPAGLEGFMGKKPITKPEDMKGQTIRSGSGLWTDWYKDLGAAPASVDGAEQYQSLQRGVIDTTAYVYYALDTYNLHEVADHVTVPGVINPILSMSMINMDTWDQISSEDQETIEEIAAETEKKSFDAMETMTKRGLEAAEENDVEIHELSDEAYEDFRESAQTVWDDFGSINEDTKKIIEKLEEDQDEYLEDHPDAMDWDETYKR